MVLQQFEDAKQRRARDETFQHLIEILSLLSFQKREPQRIRLFWLDTDSALERVHHSKHELVEALEATNALKLK